jgi:hypothetical protein
MCSNESCSKIVFTHGEDRQYAVPMFASTEDQTQKQTLIFAYGYDGYTRDCQRSGEKVTECGVGLLRVYVQ